MTARHRPDDAHAPPEITDIRPLPSDPNLRKVRVGRRVVATLRSADVEALSLEPGRPWTPALASSVQAVVAINRARASAMRMLSRRSYSRGELVERLMQQGFSAEHARTITQQLENDGWMNERAYADDVVRQAQRTGPAGRPLIEYRLRQRLVDPPIAAQAAQANSSRDERVSALALARKRLSTMKGIRPDAAARRLSALLGRRGFDEDVVVHILHALGLTRTRDD
jgi:regulatory protein